jgi:hypothetical protein
MRAVERAASELKNGGSGYWQGNLASAITRNVAPSRSIPIAAQALKNSNADVRRYAAIAIYQTDSVDGIAPLLQARWTIPIRRLRSQSCRASATSLTSTSGGQNRRIMTLIGSRA